MKNKLTEQQKVNEILSRILTNILTRKGQRAMKQFEKESGLSQNIKNIENNLKVIEKRVIKKYGKDSDQYKSIFEK
jgi:hypothetical protein|tara:strand:+ start:37 stop:264 length:228 start_codon:yes stop_codon:yes gene_type:complete